MKKSRKSFDFDKFYNNVFLHGKNADERLFDLILRAVTFIILVIFLWVYADLTHAKADNITVDQYALSLSNQYNLKWYFNDSDYSAMHDLFSDIPYNSNFNYGNVDIPGKMVYTEDMDLENYYFAICRNYWSTAGRTQVLCLIPKDIDFCVINEEYYYSSSDFDFNYIYCRSDDSLNTSYYLFESYTCSSGTHPLNELFGSSYSSYYFFGNVPNLKGSNVDAQSYFSNGNDFDNCYNANYLMYHDLIIDPSAEVESSKNHLALSDIQVGLTSFDKEMTDLSESSVVVGVGVDDNWILSHMNDYTVGIEYHFYIKDSNMNQSDPISMYNQTVPLSYFKDSPVTYGVANLMSSSMIAPFPSNRDFYSYYRSLSSSYGQKVVTREHRDGFFPAVLKNLYRFTIGGYYIDNPVTTNNTIFEFYLDVKVRLMAEGESGGYYTKRFDFKRGTVSILGADAFQNPNPWEGPSSPESEYDPNVPSGSSGSSSGGGASAVAYGGNVNVVINNNNKLGDLVGDDDDSPSSTISEYLSAIDEMKGSIETLTNEDDEEITSSKSFNQFLKDNLETFPGMNLMISVIKIVVGICLIIIAIKLLLAIF